MMDNYRGIGEADRLLAEANALRWSAERELVKACKRIVELEADVASLRARLAELDGVNEWRTGEVPEGIDEVQLRKKDGVFCTCKRDGDGWRSHFGRYLSPLIEYRWREVK